MFSLPGKFMAALAFLTIFCDGCTKTIVHEKSEFEAQYFQECQTPINNLRKTFAERKVSVEERIGIGLGHFISSLEDLILSSPQGQGMKKSGEGPEMERHEFKGNNMYNDTARLNDYGNTLGVYDKDFNYVLDYTRQSSACYKSKFMSMKNDDKNKLQNHAMYDEILNGLKENAAVLEKSQKSASELYSEYVNIRELEINRLSNPQEPKNPTGEFGKKEIDLYYNRQRNKNQNILLANQIFSNIDNLKKAADKLGAEREEIQKLSSSISAWLLGES